MQVQSDRIYPFLSLIALTAVPSGFIRAVVGPFPYS